MVVSTRDEAQNDAATPKKKASQKTASRQKKDDKGSAAQNKATAIAPGDAASKAKTARKRGAKVPSRAAAVSAEERQKMIAAVAYYRAEARGFAPGHEHEDWLVAEREVDVLLGR